MVKEFIDYYGKNIAIESKLIKGAKDFLDWSKKNNIQMGICTNKQEHLAINLLKEIKIYDYFEYCLLYTSPSPRDRTRSRMPSSA